VRVAVVGGGIFGCTAAVELARNGAQVDLYERHGEILSGTTGRIQARLHRGYHYPRSPETAAALRTAAHEFASRFHPAVRTYAHHYVIARDSKVSAEGYLAFCDRMALSYEVVEPVQVHGAQVCVRVPESLVDVGVLRRLLRAELSRAGVNLHLGQRVEPVGYDLTVRATYGQPWSRPLRYEVCETALVEVSRYEGQSFVVLDGDHASLDPYGRVHMLYDVANSVHHAGVGYEPQIPDEYVDLLNGGGPIRTPLSRHEAMLETASTHLRGLGPRGQGIAIYHGSWFSVRAVLPDVDGTDERPTLVERDGDVVSVLGGKLGTALTAARAVREAALVPA
jgi:FAD dependent oxidoreductase